LSQTVNSETKSPKIDTRKYNKDFETKKRLRIQTLKIWVNSGVRVSFIIR
jgi:hypothetical protein